MQIYTTDETNRKIKEIKKKRLGFNSSEEFRKLIDKIYNESWAEDLDNLIKRELEISNEEKRILEEKKLVKEKIKKAKLEGPKKKKFEEEKQRMVNEKREYQILIRVNGLLNEFKINREEAEELARDYFLLSDYERKDMRITEFAIRKGFKLNSASLSKIKSNINLYLEYQYMGYKFD